MKTQLKVHRHLVEQIFTTVFDIFRSGKPADRVLEAVLKNQKKWGARDRRFFAENVYEIVRYWRRYWYAAGFEDRSYLDRESLSIEQVQDVWCAYRIDKNEELPDWVQAPKGLRVTKQASAAIRDSIPDWLEEIGQSEFQDRWRPLMASLNKQASVYLRANLLKTSRSKLIVLLAEDGIEAEEVQSSEFAVRLPVRKNVFVSRAFREGFFEVQDYASQTVAPLLAPRPGDRVIDACAGAGGKSLHLAMLMKNKGKIICLDIHEWKLAELRERARRNGLDCIETRVIESTKVIKRLEGSADKLLLDVPCSGLGVLRRNPDSKWRLSIEEINRLQQLQSQLLDSYSRMVKAGGAMVYATCSILPDENNRQVAKFLASPVGQDFRLEKEETHLPSEGDWDGFYAARLVRS